MKRKRVSFGISQLLLPIIIGALFNQSPVRSQDNIPSASWPFPSNPDSIAPMHVASRNIAIISKINGAAAGIKSIALSDSIRLLITTIDAKEGWAVYSLDKWNQIEDYGKILLDDTRGDMNFVTRDVDIIQYEASHRIILAISNLSDSSRIIIFPLNETNLQKIREKKLYTMEMDSVLINSIQSVSDIEQILQSDGRLFIASNTNRLYICDVSSPDLVDTSSMILQPSLPTLHPDVKIYEVKAYTRENGDHLVGLGLVRSGMCILRFDQNWSIIDTTYQIYDFDRTLFPDTIINPNKDYFNPSFTGNPADGENNKWDWRISHSVLPYDMGGGHFVLTTDEYTRYQGFQDISGAWLDPPYEAQDYFLPNLYSITDTGSGYFKGKLVATGIPTAVSLNEDEEHRLNYLHKNHPMRPGTDPNKLQGAFLRIWNRDSLGNNTLSANTGGMILSAYDPGEDPSNPVGYFGRSDIPDTAMVPFGVHEPIIAGNRLYLAGYNSGARVLSLDGSDMKLLGYCRTEQFLSNNPADTNFYGRPDIYMYAKGIYRLIPDAARSDILFGSDLNNGTWIYKFYDHAISDTIRHIAFQDTVEIGRIDADTAVYIVTDTTVVKDDARVRFVDNTRFRFDPYQLVVIDGVLQVGSVYFDSTNSAALSRFHIAPGGVISFGGQGKTVSGIHTVIVDSGATMTIEDGTTINTVLGGSIAVNGTLNLASVTLNGNTQIVCGSGGEVRILDNAEIAGLRSIRVEHGGMLTVGDESTVKMAMGGSITTSGCINTTGVAEWARFQSMVSRIDSFPSAASWLGIVLDTLDDSYCEITNLHIHHENGGITSYNSTPVVGGCELTYNFIGAICYNASPFPGVRKGGSRPAVR